jgi:PiT family inorganic phosphate transporter
VNGDIILVIVIATALAFDLTNGFHDTANVVATAISTRAIAPRPAVAAASLLNFAGAFISLKVATTVAKGFVATDAVTMTVVFAGLVGAIAWNVITWYFGLPSSSSHALIGGLVGAVAAASGFGAVNGDGLISDLIVYGLVRSNDMRREHRSLAAAGFALLGVVAVLLTAALVVFGLILLARKS